MRRVIYLGFVTLLAALLSTSVYAQLREKVVERSAKRVPSWVNSSQTDYIITSAIDIDIERAKNQCLDNVRRAIIEAVAENVKSSTEGGVDQKIIDSEVVSFLEHFTSSYQTQAAPIPVLKGVSSSRVEESYWEKRYNKSTKETRYIYSIKYPFPSLELKKMIREFERKDKEIYEKFKQLEGELNGVGSVEQIDRAISDLGPIIDYFFDDIRKGAAKQLRTNYQGLYKNITFRSASNRRGEYVLYLVLEGRAITSSQRVAAKSDYATEISVEQQDSALRVSYKSDYALPTDENSITLNFRLGGNSVPHKFYFDVKGGEIEIWPEGVVYLVASQQQEKRVKEIAVRINIKSAKGEPYIIKSLMLDVPGVSKPLFMDQLNHKGSTMDATIDVMWVGEVDVVQSQENRVNMLRGELYVESPIGEQSKRVEFSIPFKSNW